MDLSHVFRAADEERVRAHLNVVRKARVNEDLTREVLEAYPRDARLPNYDFGKPDNFDTGVACVDATQIRLRGGPGVPACAEVYEGYVPIDRLDPYLTEREEPLWECADCRHIDSKAAFRKHGYRECPSCEGGNVGPQEDTYPWDEFSPRATFPAAEVRVRRDGQLRLDDGNHRVHYWGEHGRTHAPAWVVDERPCNRRRRRKS